MEAALPDDAVAFTLRRGQGASRDVDFPVAVEPPGPARTGASTLALPAAGPSDLAWGFLDDGKQARAALIAVDEGYQIRRYSALYFAKYANDSPELLAERGLAVGDLDFGEEEQWRRRQIHGLDPTERQAKRALFDRGASMMPSFDAVYRAGTHAARWTPTVKVVTSVFTYSAGFDLAGALYKMGATIVGVPSAQAGNCYIDSLPFTLTHSGLTGSISYKRSLTFSGDAARGEVLQPHVALSYSRFAAMGFDPDAAVRLVLE